MPRQKRAYGYGNTSGKPPAPAAARAPAAPPPRPRGQRFVQVPGIAIPQHPQSYLDREGEHVGFPPGAAPIGLSPFFDVAQRRVNEAAAGTHAPRVLTAAQVAALPGNANFLVLPQAAQMVAAAPPPPPPQAAAPPPQQPPAAGSGRVKRRVQPMSGADYWGNSRMELSGNPLRPHQHFSSVYSPEAVVTQFR